MIALEIGNYPTGGPIKITNRPNEVRRIRIETSFWNGGALLQSRDEHSSWRINIRDYRQFRDSETDPGSESDLEQQEM
jgi:hypothetical protein